jgi:hypothetical protein
VAFFFINTFFIVFFSITLCSSANVSLDKNYSLKEVEKVLGLIAELQQEQLEPHQAKLRDVAVTENELNSYIAYRIEVEKSDIMKELRLKLFHKNKIEGKIYIDLRGQELSGLLRPEMNLYFGGVLETQEGMVRLDLESLYLEDQPIQPKILDMVIYFGSKIQGTEPFSLNDWFELPYGIKDVKTEKGRAVFYY